MDSSHGRRCERPRKRGRALTYEEKWMVQHVFETVEQEKTTGVILSRHDPYGLTSKYTGVARSLVATITKSRETHGDRARLAPSWQLSPADHHPVSRRREDP